MKIVLLHGVDTDKLAAVKGEMEKLGAPTVKAVWMDSYQMYFALEGTHRLTAAHELGLIPEIQEIEWSEEATTSEVAPGSFPDDEWVISDLIDHMTRDLNSNRTTSLEF